MDDICPICDDPLADRGYSEIVTDEYGARVHEACLQLSDDEQAKYLTRDERGRLIYR